MRLTQVRTAWLWLVVALALHVIDEASTGFLDVYNPTVRALRERFGWFPMPESASMSGDGTSGAHARSRAADAVVDRGPRALRVATVIFAGLMALNGVAHITGTYAGVPVATVRFERPMPGSWSSPLLIGAAVFFIVRARDRDGVTA